MANELSIVGSDDEFEEAKEQAKEQAQEELALIEEEKESAQEETAEEVQEEAVPEIKQVPLPELLSERRARQEAQKQLEELQTKFTTVDERLERINEKLNPAPTVEDDPFGALASKQDKISESVQDIRTQLEESQQQTQQNNLQNQVTNMEQEFKRAHPDYDQAATHLTQYKLAEYEMAGLVDPLAQQNKLQSDLAELIQNSLSSGKNPAQSVYDLAKRTGFSQSQPGNEPQKSGDKRSLKQIAQGVEQKSLSSTGGGAPKDGIDLDMLSEMSEDEFNATLDALEKDSGSHPDKVWRSLHK